LRWKLILAIVLAASYDLDTPIELATEDDSTPPDITLPVSMIQSHALATG
jgi:hypothetical protein